MPSYAGWEVVVLVLVLVLVLGVRLFPDLVRVTRSFPPSRRRPAPVFGVRPTGPDPDPDGPAAPTVELPLPDLPFTPGRPPYATSMFPAVTADGPADLSGGFDPFDASADQDTVRGLVAPAAAELFTTHPDDAPAAPLPHRRSAGA